MLGEMSFYNSRNKFKSLGNVVILDAKQTPIGTYIHGLLHRGQPHEVDSTEEGDRRG